MPRNRLRLLATATVLGLLAAPLAAKPLEVIDLALGQDADNAISRPLFDLADVAPIRIGALRDAVDHQGEVVRRVRGGFARALRYDHAARLDYGDLVARALRSQGLALGLPIGREGDGWTVDGTVHDFYLDNRPVTMGPIVFFGFLDLELTLRHTRGDERTVRYRLHGMAQRYNAGFGARDEAGEGAARFLVDSTQAVMARLAREAFGARPLPTLRALAEVLAVTASEDRADDEDVRFSILQALSQLDPDAALMLATTKGFRDKSAGVRVLSDRLKALAR